MINKKAFNKFKTDLASKLHKGCELGAEVLKENTPIDTKRLWESTRADSTSIEDCVISCRIVAGGLSLYGTNREQFIKRDVDYAIEVETRTNYARNSLVEITQTIVNELY